MGRRDPSSDPFGVTFSRKREKDFESRSRQKIVTARHFSLDILAKMFLVCSHEKQRCNQPDQ